MLAGETGEQLLVQVREEAGEAAAIHNDGVADLVPERPVEIAGRDAEVSADIDDDGAHGAAAHLGGDLLFRGEVRETWVFGGVRWLGVGRCDLPHGARPACDGQAIGAGVRSWPRAARRQSRLRAPRRGAGRW